MLKQYDIVQIITTKNIRYLSGPTGMTTDPHGNWSVVGFIKADALVAKDSTLVRVPVVDLRKVASMSTVKFYDEISQAGYLKSNKINMVPHVASVFGINIAKAKRMLLNHNLALEVKTIGECDMIVSQLNKIMEGTNG